MGSGRGRGFTLAEVLAAVGIVAVLSAILAPVLAGARSSAQCRNCAARVRACLLANSLYRADSEDIFPLPTQSANDGAAQDTDLIWTGLLQPYAGTLEAVCPLAVPVRTSNGHAPAPAQFTGLTFQRIDRAQLSIGANLLLAAANGYQCNQALRGNGSIAACNLLYNDSLIEDLSRLPLYGDSVSVGIEQAGGGYILSPLRPWNGPFGAALRHSGTLMNLGSADGHVALSRGALAIASKLWNGKNGAGQCVNYNAKGLEWDPSAPAPSGQPTCRGQSVWN